MIKVKGEISIIDPDVFEPNGKFLKWVWNTEELEFVDLQIGIKPHKISFSELSNFVKTIESIMNSTGITTKEDT